MSYEQKLSMQGVEVTLRLNHSGNEVIFDLILTSESGEKLETTGSLTHFKEAHLKQLEKEYEERVKEEKFSTIYLALMLKRINRSSSFEEKKVSFIECMTYLYVHKEEIVRYENFMDIMINKCYEIKEGHPDDGELNGVCDKILTHFGMETDVAVYAKKKAEPRLNELYKLEEQRYEQEQEALKKEPIQRLKERFQVEEYRCEQVLSQADQKNRGEHLQLLEKIADTYDVHFSEDMYELYMLWKARYDGNARNRYQRMCAFMETFKS